jgi:hypothetical protein
MTVRFRENRYRMRIHSPKGPKRPIRIHKTKTNPKCVAPINQLYYRNPGNSQPLRFFQNKNTWKSNDQQA